MRSTYQLFVAITISFDQSRYDVYENDTSVQPVLKLSNPSVFDINVQVRSTSMTATGM